MSLHLAEELKRGGGRHELYFELWGGESGAVSTGAPCWQLTVQGLYLLGLG